jgi:hypothetical protein
MLKAAKTITLKLEKLIYKRFKGMKNKKCNNKRKLNNNGVLNWQT